MCMSGYILESGTVSNCAGTDLEFQTVPSTVWNSELALLVLCTVL